MDEIKLDQKSFDALVAKFGEDASKKINALFSEAEKGNKDALTELKAKIGEISQIDGKSIVEFVKVLQTHANDIETQLKEFKTTSKKDLTFNEALSLDLKKQMPAIQTSFKALERKEFKAVGDMSIIDNYGAGVVKPLYLPGITGIAKRRTTLYDVLNKVPWAGDVVHYIENSGGEGTISAKLENAASSVQKFPQKDYDFVKRTMSLSKIPAYSKVTNEMMENSENVVAFIQNELVRDVLLQLENDILKGNGTGANMKGLQHSDHYTAAAIPGSYTLPSGVTPNEMDVLRAIITQQLNLYFNAGIILMHPTDVMKMDLARDDNGAYLLPPFITSRGNEVKGVPIVEHANLSEGTFHVIDPSRVNLYIQRGLTLRLWDQVEADPLYDLMTMTASVKAGVLVKNNEKGANIYGTFSTLITAMTGS